MSDFITKYDRSKHDGDCTHKPYACDQCIIDSYREDAKAIINKEAFFSYITEEGILEQDITKQNV